MQIIILDRDGVINEDSDAFIKTPEEWCPIPGSLPAIARLSNAGYHVIVVSNQSGVGRGLFDVSQLCRIHAKMHAQVRAAGGSIDAVFFCPTADDLATCRKPSPGMFLDLASRLGIGLAGIPAIGDTLRDVQAARAAGATPFLVKTGKGAATLAHHAADLIDVSVFPDLQGAANYLLDHP